MPVVDESESGMQDHRLSQASIQLMKCEDAVPASESKRSFLGNGKSVSWM